MRSESPASSVVELDVRGAHPHLVALGPVDLCAEIDEQLEHRLDVADARHVAEHDRLRA